MSYRPFNALARLQEYEADMAPPRPDPAPPDPSPSLHALPEAWAAALDAVSEAHPPAGILRSEWEQRVRLVRRFADAYGAAVCAAGWSYAETFGAGENWRRSDHWGAAWFLSRHAIERVGADAITAITASGARVSVRRVARERE